MNTPEILNERQVQEVYGFSVPYLRRARRERRGPRFLKVGKLVRYRKADIEVYLSAHTVETGASQALSNQALSNIDCGQA
jgi:predicted DNA-binding transcriptional regulator AlpA